MTTKAVTEQESDQLVVLSYLSWLQETGRKDSDQSRRRWMGMVRDVVGISEIDFARASEAEKN